MWNTGSPLLLPSCHASVVGDGSMCLHLLVGECVCCTSVWPLKFALLTSRLLSAKNVLQPCWPWVSQTSMCISMSWLWDHLPHICRPPDILRLLLHLASHDQGFQRGRCAPYLPSQHENGRFIAHLPQVLLGAGAYSWLLTSVVPPPLQELWCGESPNEEYESIKQAFNLPVDAQELLLPSVSYFSGLQSWERSHRLLGFIRFDQSHVDGTSNGVVRFVAFVIVCHCWSKKASSLEGNGREGLHTGFQKITCNI